MGIKCALIGYGFAGKTFHTPFLTTLPEFSLDYIYSTKKDIVLEKHPNLIVTSNLDEILSQDSIELVIITAPNQLHYSLASKFLQANKHVVVEKPFTSTHNEAKELINLAASNNKIITVFHNRRWDNQFLTLKDIISQKKLGNIYYYEARWERFRPEANPSRWKEQPDKSGGVLYDLGSHLIDQAICLFGMPKNLFADIQSQRDNAITDDYFQLILGYNNKLRVNLFCSSIVKHPSISLQVHGTTGSYIKYDLDPQEEHLQNGIMPNDELYGIESKNNWGKLNNIPYPSTKGDYSRFYKTLAKAIRNNSPPPITDKEAANTIYLLEAAMLSNSSNSWVEI